MKLRLDFPAQPKASPHFHGHDGHDNAPTCSDRPDTWCSCSSHLRLDAPSSIQCLPCSRRKEEGVHLRPAQAWPLLPAFTRQVQVHTTSIVCKTLRSKFKAIKLRHDQLSSHHEWLRCIHASRRIRYVYCISLVLSCGSGGAAVAKRQHDSTGLDLDLDQERTYKSLSYSSPSLLAGVGTGIGRNER